MANDKLRFFAFAVSYVSSFAGTLLINKLKAIIHSLTYGGPTAIPKTVAVIGGSFAGVQIARRLTETLPTGWRVVLIEKNSHLNFSFDLPRFAVVPGHERNAFIPYEAIFASAPKGIVRVVHAPAASLTSEAVQLATLDARSGDTTIPYDIAVLAVGSASRPPAKLLAAANREAACAELQALQERIRAARKIAVVGGGAVGVELAADIQTFRPGDKDGEKSVTLVHSRAQLLNRFAPRLHEHALATLKKIGVRVVLGARPEIVSAGKDAAMAADAPAGLPGTLRFADGHEEDYDSVLVCTGLTPNSGVLRDLCPGAIAASGEIAVTSTLQVVGQSAVPATPLANVFAAGDVAASGGPKMARAAYFQAEVVVANILAATRGQKATKTYSPVPLEGCIKLTLGKNDSVMFLEPKNAEPILMAARGEPEDLDIKRAWHLVGAKYKKEYVA